MANVHTYIGPPHIRAIESNLMVPSGANVTLVCEIVNPGEPRATFGWRKSGETVASTAVHNSFLTITITSVTTQDTGTYTCTATGLESYDSDSIQLHVLSANNTGMFIHSYSYMIRTKQLLL